MPDRLVHLAEVDPAIHALIHRERARQEHGLELIASENFVSLAVLEALGSVLTNKYAEGLPRKRYYGGCEVVDEIEQLAIDRAKALFGAGHANVQPHSGASANLAAYLAVAKPGDTLAGLALSHGGHLTHGAPVNFSGTLFRPVQYGVREDTGRIDYDRVRHLVRAERPRILVGGGSAYARVIDFAALRSIADEVGAILVVDMAHFAGVPAGGQAVPFRFGGDGKILLSARVANPDSAHPSPPLTLVLDTGASKTALFEGPLTERVRSSEEWPAMRGLSAPTLFDEAAATMARVPRIELLDDGQPAVTLDGMDAAIIRSELGRLLSLGIGEPVTGLLGYSFLKHFRIALDLVHRVAWFSPAPPDWDGRGLEYVHVGLQVERRVRRRAAHHLGAGHARLREPSRRVLPARAVRGAAHPRPGRHRAGQAPRVLGGGTRPAVVHAEQLHSVCR